MFSNRASWKKMVNFGSFNTPSACCGVVYSNFFKFNIGLQFLGRFSGIETACSKIYRLRQTNFSITVNDL